MFYFAVVKRNMNDEEIEYFIYIEKNAATSSNLVQTDKTKYFGDVEGAIRDGKLKVFYSHRFSSLSNLYVPRKSHKNIYGNY